MGGEEEEEEEGEGDREVIEAEVMAKGLAVVQDVDVVLAPSVEGELGCLHEGYLVLTLGRRMLLPRQAQNYRCFSVYLQESALQ